ncbi:type II toxin-antitoxin system PemK/MazF family toxin [Halochromatium roseum]|uniref:type II toxin-antitoxin system PemK/MazF family toxin n=1 Tax=Halochromatium roseum TaxID=391920 RepID=UPI0019134B32|nr:hypothetical protein [Halochromatium roseum]MCF8004898.1 type II toxin-antitoxin system PemK/MazF family toxin [Chromatiaceae bacterium]
MHTAAARPGSILACPFTTYEEAAPYRARFDLPAGEAVRRSYVMVDKLTAVRRDRLGAQIGRASSQQMQQVASAMRGILGLIEP